MVLPGIYDDSITRKHRCKSISDHISCKQWNEKKGRVAAVLPSKHQPHLPNGRENKLLHAEKRNGKFIITRGKFGKITLKRKKIFFIFAS